ncbi:MAG TPA: flagellar protein FlgN [Selenomonadales bacterium]|nr:flagellar protein FlgN [Selenomonadales bacterium]
MKEKWDKLAALTEEARDMYGVIVELARQKRDILVGVRAEELDKITRQEELLIPRIGKLQGGRDSIMRELAARYHLTDQSTFEEFTAFAPEDVAERLVKATREWGELVQELVQLNQVNADMLQRTLSFIDYNMNLLSRTMANTTYTPPGQTQLSRSGVARSLIDQKL